MRVLVSIIPPPSSSVVVTVFIILVDQRVALDLVVLVGNHLKGHSRFDLPVCLKLDLVLILQHLCRSQPLQLVLF